MIFKRDDLKNKKNFYLILITLEIVGYISLFYFNIIHWFFLIILFPFLIIELISNNRYLKRQKNFIKELKFHKDKLICTHLKNTTTSIDFKELLFSFREVKFEKDQSEIEIKRKGNFRNKLIGRIHINNWTEIFEIKNEFLSHEITRIKFRPEGFWSKYGGLTADVVITASALVGELNDFVGDTQGASNARDLAFQTDFDSLHKKHENKKSN